jgi:hypothetical protein
VFEPLLVRTPLVPSRLHRRLQRLAAALCLLTAGLLAAAAIQQRDVLSPAFVLLTAALVLTLLAVGLLLRGRSQRGAAHLTIGADGTITAVTAATDKPLVLRPTALTPLSVVLHGDGASLVVWRDSLPAEGFRRLCAVARWHVERGAAQTETA